MTQTAVTAGEAVTAGQIIGYVGKMCIRDRCMTISEYPQQLDDKFISALLQQVPYIVLSIDIAVSYTHLTHGCAP